MQVPNDSHSPTFKCKIALTLTHSSAKWLSLSKIQVVNNIYYLVSGDTHYYKNKSEMYSHVDFSCSFK